MKIINYIKNFFKKIIKHIKLLYTGRLGRLDYFTSPFALLFLIVLPASLPFIIYGAVGMIATVNGIDILSDNLLVLALVPVVTLSIISAVIYTIIFAFGTVVRRGHDIGWSGGVSVCLFLLGQAILVPLFFFLFQKSDKGENDYGVRPQGKYLKRVFGIEKMPVWFKYFYYALLGLFVCVLIGVASISFYKSLSGVEDSPTPKRVTNNELLKDINGFKYEPKVETETFTSFNLTLRVPAYMRQSPSANSGMVRAYADTATVKIIGEQGDWYKIQARDDEGNTLIGWMTKSAF